MTKQEKRNKYIELIPTLEGQKYMPNDYAAGQGTRFGVSVAFTNSFRVAEDRKITEQILRTAPFSEFVPFISRFLARIGYDAINSMALSLSYGDHAYNTGWSGAMGDIQKFLIIRYRAKIPFDGKVGPKTIAAINAAIRQYGENQVVTDWYRWRKAYYEGRNFPTLTGGAKNRNGCKKAVCRVIISSRLDKYFGVQNRFLNLNAKVTDDDIFQPHGKPLDETNNSSNPSTTEPGAELPKNDNTPKNYTTVILIVVAALLSLSVLFYFYKK